MKKLFIPLVALLLSTLSCSSVKNMGQEGKMQIITAEYKKWSEPPVQNSDVPEKGTDLFVTVQDWPQDAVPVYIVYQNKKSFKPEIADSSDNHTVIKGRIITTSSVLEGRPGKTELSDRLTYTTAKGDTSYVEIDQWQRKKQ